MITYIGIIQGAVELLVDLWPIFEVCFKGEELLEEITQEGHMLESKDGGDTA